MENTILCADGVCKTNSSLHALHGEAVALVDKLDGFVLKLEGSQHSVLNKALKAAIFFAIECINDPVSASTLPAYGAIKTPLSANPYLHPMKYLTRAIESKSVRNKLTMWAAIAKDVAERDIDTASFFGHLERHGGYENWYRVLPKVGKGGRPTKQTATQDCQAAATETIAAPVANPYVSPTVALKAKRGRQLVAIVFDISQSATFDLHTLQQRFQSMDEFVDVVPVANVESNIIEANSERKAA